MLILGKKNDYYDGVVGTMGIDKTIVYDRKQTEFVEGDMPKVFQTRHSYSIRGNRGNSFSDLGHYSINKDCLDKYQDISHFIVGFCGKLYIGWKLYTVTKEKYGYPKSTYIITYDFELVKSLVTKKSWYSDSLEDEVNYVRNYDAMELFRELKAPTFVYNTILDLSVTGTYHRRGSRTLIVNPILSEFGFFKVFNSFQAFQEIQMFLGGVLGVNEKPMVVVADKYKIAQHGFDKFSFRKDKEVKK